MLNPLSPLAGLLDAPMRPGLVQWIGVRPARRAALLAVPDAALDPAHGLGGDHYRSATTGKRQVTLIGALDLAAIGAALARHPAAPEELRRNIVVTGINLHALRGRRFHLGTALLEATGDCHPLLPDGGNPGHRRLQRRARAWRDHRPGDRRRRRPAG